MVGFHTAGPPVSYASLPDCQDRSAALAKLYSCVLSVVGEDQRGWRLKRVALLRLLCAGVDEGAGAGGAPAGMFVQLGVHVPGLGQELKEVRGGRLLYQSSLVCGLLFCRRGLQVAGY